MNSVFKRLVGGTAILAPSSFLLAVILTAPPAPEPPYDPDMARPSFSLEMRSSVAAYFKTHSLDKSTPLAPGLVIPWMANELGAIRHGFLVATGILSKKGCPVFDVSEVRHFMHREDQKIALCP